MKCNICGKDFAIFKKYIFHIEFFHKIMNYFSCPFTRCGRVYNKKHNLREHIKKKHSNSDNTSCGNSNNKFLVDDNELFIAKDNTSSNIPESAPIVDKCENLDNTEQFKKIFNESIKFFLANLYDKLTLTRNDIQDIVLEMDEFISVIMRATKNCVFDLLQLEEHRTKINIVFQLLCNPFSELKTEYKRMQYFQNLNTFIRPEEIQIGIVPEQQKKKGEISIHLKRKYAYYIPLDKTLTHLFELPHVYKIINCYKNECLKNFLDNKIISNSVNGSVWNEIEHEHKDDLFPLVLYFDDFEPGNPLGSTAGNYKIGTIYFSIPTIPPEYYTRLENIFLALIFNSNERGQFGNDVVFRKLITDLKHLESHGIEVNISSEKKRIYFTTIAFLGDNLGIHSMFGLHESFSSTYYCRFCTSTKNEMNFMLKENENNLRIVKNYEDNLKNNIGIKERCVFNVLPNFHIYNNFSCDIMHDLFEGVHRYDMAFLIDGMISKNYFSLGILNDRIQHYQYESSEKNIPPHITKEHLNKKCIIFSASEMHNLVKNFRFFVGDLVPENDVLWELYLTLLNITTIVTCSSLTQESIDLLKFLVETHHELFINLFNTNLKPKHHFLLHYARVVAKMGPLTIISSIRFEGKHRDFKSPAHHIRSRKNLPLSLALRNQLKNLFRFISNRGFNVVENFGKCYELDKNFTKGLNFSFENFHGINWYELNGVKYNVGSVLVYEVQNEIPYLFHVKHIIVDKTAFDGNIRFICNALKCLEYSKHFEAFEVIHQTQLKVLDLKNCYSSDPTVIHTLCNGRSYVSV